MRFGEETSPRIYTWGNLGVPATNAAANVVMAVARATEGGKFSRNYVPMHDASTTEPVVRQVRWPYREHDKHVFPSLTVVTGDGTTPRAVVAVDIAGGMWAWGTDVSRADGTNAYDSTGLGGPELQDGSGYMHRPVRVITPQERATSNYITWAKVQSKPKSFATVAISQDGKLYGTGILPSDVFLDSFTVTANVYYTAFSQLSTQTWKDFAFAAGSFWAIRNDRTLHTKSATFSPITTDTQVKGMVVDAYLNQPFSLQTGTSQTLTYTVSMPPAGGVRAEIVVANNTTTGDYRPYVRVAGRNYTSTPAVTRVASPAPVVNRSLTLQMSNDANWSRIDSNGNEAILFCDAVGGGTNAFMLQPSASHLPDGGFFKTHGNGEKTELFHLWRPLRNSNDNTFENVIGNMKQAAIHWDAARADDTDASGEYALYSGSRFYGHTNNSNVVSWGQNQDGCLAVGHTNKQSTIAFNSSPDTVLFQAFSLSLGGNYSLAVRGDVNSQIPGSPRFARHLYCAGAHGFAGNSAATSAITTFTACTPESVNRNHVNASAARKWHPAVFAHSVGGQQFSVASRDYAEESNDNEPLT